MQMSHAFFVNCLLVKVMAQIFRHLVVVRWSVFMLKRAKNVSEYLLLEV